MQPTTNSNRIPFDDGRPLTAKDQYRLELLEIERLSPLEERRLADMACAGNEEAGELLVESCLMQVRSCAWKYAQKNPDIDELDLVQVGNEAMVRNLPVALGSRNACAVLLMAARYAIIRYCYEDKL